ncbi:MAG: hypothetical protein R3C26_00955 [Calditrichia bacterium]
MALGLGRYFFAFPQSVSETDTSFTTNGGIRAPAVYMDVWSGIDAKFGNYKHLLLLKLHLQIWCLKILETVFLATFEIDLAIIRKMGSASKAISFRIQFGQSMTTSLHTNGIVISGSLGLPNGYYRAEAAVTDKNINKALVKGIQFNVDLGKRTVDVKDLMLGKKDVIQLQGKGRIASVLPDAHQFMG